MEITELLTPELIDLNLTANSKKEVLTKLIDLLDQAGKLDSKDEFYQAIQAREKESSTGVGHGVAIPHAKSEAVNSPALVFARSNTGVDFGSRDDKPAHLFFLIAVPETSSSQHLKILSTLSRQLMHEEFRQSLQEAASKEELLAVLTKEE